MTDRELLELAAKAAGHRVIVDAKERGLWIHGMEEEWNPLHDDAEALRLAVKLKIDVFGDNEYRRAEIDNWNCAEYAVADPYAATRRAIVRAAAEIGRGME